MSSIFRHLDREMNARLLIVLMTKPERLIIELKRTGGESQ